MNEEELFKNLREYDIDLKNACVLINLKTDAIINPNHIRTTFERSQRLSEPMTAMFRLFFAGLKHEKI